MSKLVFDSMMRRRRVLSIGMIGLVVLVVLFGSWTKDKKTESSYQHAWRQSVRAHAQVNQKMIDEASMGLVK